MQRCAPSPEGKVTCFTQFDSKGGETKVCQLQIVGKAGDTPCIGTKDGEVTSYSTDSGTNAAPPSRGYICNVASGLSCDGTAKQCVVIPAERQYGGNRQVRDMSSGGDTSSGSGLT